MRNSMRWITPAALSLACSGLAAMALADMEIAPAKPPANAPGARAEKRWQPGERMGGETGPVWAERMEGERIIDRVLANPEVMEKLGVTEEALGKLRAEIKDVQTRSIDLDAQVRKLAVEQADQMSKFLQSPDANTNALMKLADDLGKARTDQAKLMLQRLFVIRKYMTPEQIAKAREMMRDRLLRERGENGEGKANKTERQNRKADKPAGAPPPKPPEGW